MKASGLLRIILMAAVVTISYYLLSELRHVGKDTVLYMSSSTQKFVNHWLEEGPVNLKFVMYEDFPSIEFNSLNEREAYVSYPPGAVAPPYIAAKALGMSHIDVQFIQGFMKFWFLLSSILACLVFYGLLSECLKTVNRTVAAASSALMTVAWMLIPVNLFAMRNLYFADQCVIPIVFLFILTEIYRRRFEDKPRLIRWLFNVFRFAVSLFGVMTDYYFLSVLFVAWLIRIVPLLKGNDGRLKRVIYESWMYVLPVIIGLGLFALQVSTVDNGWTLLLGKLEQRTYSKYTYKGHIEDVNLLFRFLRQYASAFSLYGAIFTLIFAVVFVYNTSLFLKGRTRAGNPFPALFGVSLLVFAPPVIHSLVLLNHTVNHGFAMVKFTFPFVCFALLPVMYAVNRYRITFLPAMAVMLAVMVVSTHGFRRLRRYNTIPNITELSIVIGDNCGYNDVCFCFTDSIPTNPPMQHVISEKQVYPVKSEREIHERFPNLNGNAKILLVIEADGDWKDAEIKAVEDSIRKQSSFRFASEHYEVYEIKRR
ncbi:MAG: hypothetical protein LBS54_00345 [Dysgonamonadaceae bacterium]|jgi:hypothetical protein|nr:hypothetical protein [Dysgonamonadaceae bacterium]